MALVPGSFYLFIVASYILNARIGFNLSWTVSYLVAGVLVVAYVALFVWKSRNVRAG
jgi:branched-subunit amino acid transport protein